MDGMTLVTLISMDDAHGPQNDARSLGPRTRPGRRTASTGPLTKRRWPFWVTLTRAVFPAKKKQLTMVLCPVPVPGSIAWFRLWVPFRFPTQLQVQGPVPFLGHTMAASL